MKNFFLIQFFFLAYVAGVFSSPINISIKRNVIEKVSFSQNVDIKRSNCVQNHAPNAEEENFSISETDSEISGYLNLVRKTENEVVSLKIQSANKTTNVIKESNLTNLTNKSNDCRLFHSIQSENLPIFIRVRILRI